MLALNVKAFAATMIVFGLIAVGTTADVHLPGNHVGYAPEQPIAFSHRLHAGELKIDCVYCHYAARRSRTAGVPPASICMNCHKVVTAGFDAMQAERKLAATEKREPRRVFSPEIRKIYDALGLDGNAKPKVSAAGESEAKPIEWVRVHNLPDFVFFNHSVHVAKHVACQRCHGPVQAFERMRQYADLSMGWCLDCHRNTQVADTSGKTRFPTTDCGACHY